MALATRFLPLSLAAALLALLGTGCAVYVPATPTTPLVSKGQVEIGVGGHVLPSPLLELNAAYAPTSHLLVSVETGFMGNTGSSTTNNVTTTYTDHYTQGSVGLGYYRAPTASDGWYLAAVGGVGLTSLTLHTYDFFLIFPYPSGTYEARFWRYYAQGYAAKYVSRRFQTGLSLRSTLVNYQDATYGGQSFSPPNRTYLEPTAFLRFGKKGFYGQFNFGLSVPLGIVQETTYNRQLDAPALLIGGSLVLQPGYWWQRQAK